MNKLYTEEKVIKAFKRLIAYSKQNKKLADDTVKKFKEELKKV